MGDEGGHIGKRTYGKPQEITIRLSLPMTQKAFVHEYIRLETLHPSITKTIDSAPRLRDFRLSAISSRGAVDGVPALEVEAVEIAPEVPPIDSYLGSRILSDQDRLARLGFADTYEWPVEAGLRQYFMESPGKPRHHIEPPIVRLNEYLYSIPVLVWMLEIPGRRECQIAAVSCRSMGNPR
jgi:hypothetical protein